MGTIRRTTVGSRVGGIVVVASVMLASLALTPAASATAAVRYPLSIFAGTGASGAPTAGATTSSKLNGPSGVAVDSNGNIYIADSSNNLVEKVTPDGTLSVFAGNGLTGAPTPGDATSSAVYGPVAVAVDSDDNVYIATPDANRVLKVTPSGTLSVFAGNGSAPITPGAATSSGLSYPAGLAVDSLGNVYIADRGHRVVVKVTSDGTLSVFAGTGESGSPAAGPATSSMLRKPLGLAVDSGDNVFIVDSDSDVVLKVTSGGTLSVFAGTGLSSVLTPGPATSSSLYAPKAVAADSDGNVYIASGDYLVEKVTVDGTLSVFAGTGVWGTATAGAATSSRLKNIAGVAVDSSGNLYLADSGNNQVLKVSIGSTVDTPGAPTSPVATATSYSNWGGSAAVSFSAPDSNGGSPVINYRVTATNVTDASRGGQTGTGTTSPIYVSGLVAGDTYTFTVAATNGDANYYGAESTVSNSIVAAAPVRGDGKLLLVAGIPGVNTSSALGAPLATSLGQPTTVAISPNGDIYYATAYVGAQTSGVFKLTPAGVLSRFAGNGDFACPTGAGSALSSPVTNYGEGTRMAFDSNGNLYVPIAMYNCSMVVKITPSGDLSIFAGTGSGGAATEGLATSSKLNQPSAVAVDSADNVYIADTGNRRIEKVTPAGQLSFFAGTGSYGAPSPGAATSSNFQSLSGITVDPDDNVYVANDSRVLKISQSGVLSFFAGTGTSGPANEGAATSSNLTRPVGLVTDVNGNLYIDDMGDKRVKMVTPSGQLSFFAGNGSSGVPTPGASAISTPISSSYSLAAASNGDIYMTSRDNGVILMVSAPAPSAPSAPTSLVVTPRNGSVRVAFTRGSAGNAKITKYQYKLDDGEWIDAVGTSSPLTVTGLSNGTTYSVKLRAVNTVGAGAASEASGSFTPRTTPSAPTAVVATPGDGSVSIAFTPGANGGAAISKYQYRIGGGSWIDAGATSPITVTGLSNYTTYAIQVRAVNVAGGSAPSVSVTARPKVTSPTIAVAYSSGRNGVQVGLIAARPAGSTLVGFTVRAYAKGTTTVVSSCQIMPSSRSCYIGLLASGTEYDIRAQAMLTLRGSGVVRATFESQAWRVRVNS